jgi:hypothetical protein
MGRRFYENVTSASSSSYTTKPKPQEDATGKIQKIKRKKQKDNLLSRAGVLLTALLTAVKPKWATSLPRVQHYVST